MKRGFILILLTIVFTACSAEIVPGIGNWDCLHRELQGKKVAIVANHTSMLTAGEEEVHSVDFLRRKGVSIIKIFCPEHGFRGNADAGETIGDYRDKATGLPVVSLYGKKKKPLPEDLKGVDVVLFDMQDVGVRFYTYISTLHYVMEACAENNVSLVVADRPNPNAFYVDGPVLKPEFRSFVGVDPVPVVYGMTIGEYALMINGEGWLKDNEKCRLTVIPCRGWKREDIIELPRSPSPNLPDKTSIILYPSVCFFEGTVMNEGRGTLTPFQVFGHPKLKGMPYSYTPVSIPDMSKNPKCMGKKCYGMDLRDQFERVKNKKQLCLQWLLTAYEHYEGEAAFFTSFFDKLAGTDQLRKDILAGKDEETIRASWKADLQQFQHIRKKYLLYESGEIKR